MHKFDVEITKNARPVGHVENPKAITIE